MDFFALLTDPKVLLIIAVLALLVGLGYYTWRQSAYLEDLKMKNSKMLEQVKHGVLLDGSDDGDGTDGQRKNMARLRLKVRPDMASNMSEDTRHEADEADEADEEEDEVTNGRYDADAEADPEGGVAADTEHQNWEDDCTDEEHNAYIKELIRINDLKRANSDAYYVKTQQQSGHNGPVYDSGEEEMIFDNYADTADEASDTEIELLAQAELKLARADNNVKGDNVKSEDELLRKINSDIIRIDEPVPVIPQVVSIKTSTPSVEAVVKPEPLDNTPSGDAPKKTPRKKSDAPPKPAAKTKAPMPEAAVVKESEAPAQAPVQEVPVAAAVVPVLDHTPLKIKPVIGKKVQG
jgi:hypothetical protein